MKRMMLAWLIAGSLPIAAFAVNGSGFDGNGDMDFGSIKPVAVSYPGPVTLPAYTQCTPATYADMYRKAVEEDVRKQLYLYLQSINRPVIWETMQVVGNSSLTGGDNVNMNAIGNGLSFEMTGVDGTLLSAHPKYSKHSLCMGVVSNMHDLDPVEGTALNIYQAIPQASYGNWTKTICSLDAVVDDCNGWVGTNGIWIVQNEGNPSIKSPATRVVIARLKIKFHREICLGPACPANPAQ